MSVQGVSDRGVSVLGGKCPGVSVQGVSDRGVCVLGVSVRGVHVRGGSVLSPSFSTNTNRIERIYDIFWVI